MRSKSLQGVEVPKNQIKNLKSQTQKNQLLADEILGVIVDQRNGQSYYISLIDNFTYKNQEYAVMYNYQMEKGKLGLPEMLIMRSYRADDKQYFTSINNEEEINTVFDIFYDRFQQSI